MFEDELDFAKNYVRIGVRGVISFAENTPQEIKDKFWKVWPSYRSKIIALQEKGIFRSRYPVLPFTEPEENKKHYSEDAE